ncbi:MAG: septum formation initiator family protein [Candidatus Kapaibacterium sp.]|jgi:cell division protein FtsB
MASLQLQKRRRKLLRSPKLLLVTSVVLVLAATLLFANKGLWRHAKLHHDISIEQEKSQKLGNQEQEISKQVDQLKKEDPATTERIARERYQLKRPGEVIYREESK